MKDIFIDTSTAVKLCNPVDNSYKCLIQWLIKFNPYNLEHNAYIVVSNKLLLEYKRSIGNSVSNTNLIVIVEMMQREGRRIKISNQQINDFKRQHFSKRIIRRLRCNKEDWEHIPVVLLSYRKYALSNDNNFVYDLNNFPGFVAKAATHPNDLLYNQ